MSDRSDSESFNPFAAPTVEQQASNDSTVLVKNDYYIVANQLYCKNNLDLSNVCWLTGAVTASYRCRTFSRRLHSDSSIVGTVLLMGFSSLTLFFWYSGVQTMHAKLLHLATMAMIFIQGQGGIGAVKFQLRIGRSQKAINIERSTRRFLWLQVPIQAVFFTMANVLIEHTLFLQSVTVTWCIGWLIVATRWNNRGFKATVRKGKGDYFIVSNLESESQKTLQQRLSARPG